jgi:hypothetical protein
MTPCNEMDFTYRRWLFFTYKHGKDKGQKPRGE